jgi:hypothetical protein
MAGICFHAFHTTKAPGSASATGALAYRGYPKHAGET